LGFPPTVLLADEVKSVGMLACRRSISKSFFLGFIMFVGFDEGMEMAWRFCSD